MHGTLECGCRVRDDLQPGRITLLKRTNRRGASVGVAANTALRDKAEFDTAFEDLFANRSAEDLLVIKKKYGATGDILEAESRIGAIARDLVGHYIDNILPNGFKAQVVCHSKLAAVRYGRALREALQERREAESAKAETDAELTPKFLQSNCWNQILSNR